MGWTYPTFGPLRRCPTRSSSTKWFPTARSYLRAFDGHSSWANSKASGDWPASRGTRPIRRTARSCATPNGEATGALKGDRPTTWWTKFIPKPTREETAGRPAPGHARGQQVWAGATCTAPGGGFRMCSTCIDELRQQRRADSSASISRTSSIRRNCRPDEIEKIEQARRTYHDDWISGGAVKTMLDGVVEVAHRRHARRPTAMIRPRSENCSGTRRNTSKPSPNWTARLSDFHSCHRRQSGAPGAGRLPGRGRSESHARCASPHRAYRDHQRAGYSTLRQAGRDCQLPAAACLSGRRHAESLGAQCWAGTRAARLGVAQHRKHRRRAWRSAATGRS